MQRGEICLRCVLDSPYFMSSCWQTKIHANSPMYKKPSHHHFAATLLLNSLKWPLYFISAPIVAHNMGCLSLQCKGYFKRHTNNAYFINVMWVGWVKEKRIFKPKHTFMLTDFDKAAVPSQLVGA